MWYPFLMKLHLGILWTFTFLLMLACRGPQSRENDPSSHASIAARHLNAINGSRVLTDKSGVIYGVKMYHHTLSEKDVTAISQLPPLRALWLGSCTFPPNWAQEIAVAQQAPEAHVNVGRQVRTNHMTEVDRPIGIRQGAGNDDFLGHAC